MAIVTPPAPLPLRKVEWRLLRPSQRVRSEWTGRSQGVVLPGASRWSASGEFPPITKAQNPDQWIGFFAALDGQANSFPLRAVEGQQTTAANPVVNGTGQVGLSLNISGTVSLPAGARATIPLVGGGAQLVVLTGALTAAGSGTMQFRAPLRTAAQHGAAIEVQFPYALMSLTSPAPGWSVDAGSVYGFTVDCEEAF
jgi:hypothetical protein